MTLYCSCGHCNQYSGNRPKFCQSCGDPFDKQASRLAKASKPRERYVDVEQEVGLGFELDPKSFHAETSIPKMTVGSLIAQEGVSFERPTLPPEQAAAKQAVIDNLLRTK